MTDRADGLLVLTATLGLRYLDATAESYLQCLRATDRSASGELPWVILELARVVQRQLAEQSDASRYLSVKVPWEVTVGQPPFILAGLGLKGPGIDTRIVILFRHKPDFCTVPVSQHPKPDGPRDPDPLPGNRAGC